MRSLEIPLEKNKGNHCRLHLPQSQPPFQRSGNCVRAPNFLLGWHLEPLSPILSLWSYKLSCILLLGVLCSITISIILCGNRCLCLPSITSVLVMYYRYLTQLASEKSIVNWPLLFQDLGAWSCNSTYHHQPWPGEATTTEFLTDAGSPFTAHSSSFGLIECAPMGHRPCPAAPLVYSPPSLAGPASSCQVTKQSLSSSMVASATKCQARHF